jgi:predicted MFS family arabinose efflux permease
MELKVNTVANENTSSRRFFLFSLVVSNFAIGALPLLVMLLMVDIGHTFGTVVGSTSQINTAYSAIAVIFALMMGALSIRFRHKLLLLVGLVFLNVSTLGCLLALNFSMMFAFYALSGVGFAMVSPMAFALVGEHFSLEKRASAVGWIVAGSAMVYFIGAPLIALAANFGGWRFAILTFVVPVSLISFLLVWLGLGSVRRGSDSRSVDWKAYLSSFGEVLSNRSAFSCLVGDFFRSSSFVVILIYAASFGRQRFFQSIETASFIILVAAFCYTMGSLVSGMAIKRLGRKNTTVLTAFLSGVLGGSYVFMPIEVIYLLVAFMASWFFGMVASSANSLSLEQTPLRGTMMSLDSAAISLGSAFGTAVGGAVLLSFDYEGLGAVLGVMGIVSALMFLFFAKDPTKK